MRGAGGLCAELRVVARWALPISLLGLGGPLWAGSGEVIRLPNSAAPQHGLQLIVDTRWVDANGYRPVRVTALPWPPQSAAASRTIRVDITPRYWSSSPSLQRVTGYVEIPQGATRGETTLAVPPTSINSPMLAITVSEDGTRLDDLCQEALSRSQGDLSEAIPAMLIIDADAPTRDEREQLLRARNVSGPASAADSGLKLPDLGQLPLSLYDPNYQYQMRSSTYGVPMPAAGTAGVPAPAPPSDLATLERLAALSRVELLPPGELPQRWIDYTCFDLAFISAADLRSLAANQQGVWQALREWLATGPTLCVYDMDLSAEELGRLESLLGIPESAGPVEPNGSRPGWRAPNNNTAREDEVTELAALVREYRSDYPEGQSPDAQPPTPAAPVEPVAPAESPFLVRSVDQGRVVAMSTAQPFHGGRYDLPWLLNDLDGSTWMWYRRHGMSANRSNNDYWNWVVPGIGLTPVGVFLVLIALFVICIGPINYYLLRRRRRLYLLLLTVPAGAGLVTVALLAYALICDGLGVRVRVRGLIELDQRAGRAVSWSRQSYYAGLAPSGGLRFPEHTAVYPIEQHPWDDSNSSFGVRHLIWDGDQHLAAGYIGARSTAQYLVIDVAPAQAGLRLVEGESAAPSLQVTNQLAARIEQLIVWDREGRCFWCEGLEAGESRALTPDSSPTPGQHLRARLDQHRPEFPVGYEAGSNSFTGYRRFYARSSWDDQLAPPSFTTSLLEKGIFAVRDTRFSAPEKRTYIALTHSSPGVPLGTSQAQEEASIYVIKGKW